LVILSLMQAVTA